jgi:hypothetical protein
MRHTHRNTKHTLAIYPVSVTVHPLPQVSPCVWWIVCMDTLHVHISTFRLYRTLYCVLSYGRRETHININISHTHTLGSRQLFLFRTTISKLDFWSRENVLGFGSIRFDSAHTTHVWMYGWIIIMARTSAVRFVVPTTNQPTIHEHKQGRLHTCIHTRHYLWLTD